MISRWVSAFGNFTALGEALP